MAADMYYIIKTDNGELRYDCRIGEYETYCTRLIRSRSHPVVFLCSPDRAKDTQNRRTE